MPKTKKNGFVSDEEPAWGPETAEAREDRVCTQQYSSRACSATSSGKSDGGFPFPSALHSTHDGGAIRHSGRTNKCYWLIPARVGRNGTSNYETSLYKAAFSLAFHALLRIGEIALSKGNSHETIIQCQDVSLLTNKLMVSIKRSETDQLDRGVTLSVNASHGITCPVKAMQEFLQVRPSITRPLFCRFSGKPLTRYQFSAVLAKVLAKLSIDSKNFKSHSFRIGAATTLALQGETQHVIQLAGVNKVWVIGSSIVKRASIESRERKGGLNLGIANNEIWWQGYGGMVLSQLLPKLRVLRGIENDPDILIIHCRANILGLIELKSLLEKLQDTLEQIAKLFPRSKLVEGEKMSKLWPLVTICVEVLPPSLMVFGPPIVVVAVP
uniref:Tyr recombinase domain-containing protein n=1 Tax=Magallana gigas TaxID=29159 RepID=A0A8W8LZR6_MAGGI